MSPEHERLLDLLVVRAFLLAADERLEVAVLLAELESDGRSAVFEHHLDYAAHLENFAMMVNRNAIQFPKTRGHVFD